ncbi:MAG: NAD(P)H-binding protein [Myxococcales bacterium]|nr:NAD(P)H-binding protein [Myxococcales bacterium]
MLVTGAAGNTGREVLAALARRRLPARAAVRDRAHDALPGAAEQAAFDFRDPATWPAALAGCRAVFLLRPPAIADTRATLVPFIDAARAAGAAQIVFLSVAGAGKNKLVPHHAVEAHLIAGAAPYTLLRPGFFAQNLQDAYQRDITEDDRLYVPAGRGRVAFVDLRDVAAVAAAAFADPAAHDRQAYTLTGPEAVDFQTVAALLATALGRPIRYEAASVLGYVRHLRRRGLGWAQAAVQTVLHVGLRFGQAEAVDPTLAALLGRPGHPMRDYIAAHADRWRR